MARPEKVQLIRCDKIINPTILLREDEPLDDDLLELARSIKENGLTQPIVVTPKEKNFLLVVGFRRLSATRHNGEDFIQAIVRKMDVDKYIISRYEENNKRKDNTPLEIARHLKEMGTILECTQSDLAKRIGKSEGYVSQHLALLTGFLQVAKALRNKQITFAVARELNLVEKEEDVLNLLKYAVEGGANSLTVIGWRKNLESQAEFATPVTDENPYIPVNVADLNKFVCESCRNSFDMGQIVMIKVCLNCDSDIKNALEVNK